AQLVADLVGGEAVETALDDEAADHVIQLGPDHGQVADRRVCDPVFGAVDAVAALDLDRLRLHRGRVGPAVGLGQSEAADQFARRHAGQEPHALLLRAKGVDRIHGQRRLYAHGRAVAAVDRLDLTRDQAIGDVADARTAVLFRQ